MDKTFLPVWWVNSQMVLLWQRQICKKRCHKHDNQASFTVGWWQTQHTGLSPWNKASKATALGPCTFGGPSLGKESCWLFLADRARVPLRAFCLGPCRLWKPGLTVGYRYTNLFYLFIIFFHLFLKIKISSCNKMKRHFSHRQASYTHTYKHTCKHTHMYSHILTNIHCVFSYRCQMITLLE